MITAVIGHRGTGKSELMKRLQFYLRDQSADFIDLDSEIEKKIGKTIPELFLQHGEAYFRELERQLFLETLQKPNKEMYLVLGAGFDLSVIPETVRVLWVKRKTDLDGRIFLNRPRLHPELSPLDEYRKRAEPREQSYHRRADEIYLMPEGQFENHHHAMSIEKSILTHSLKDVAGLMTIPAEVFSTTKRWTFFKERYSGCGLSFFELRDDLLTANQIRQAINEMPAAHFIYSFRKNQNWNEFWNIPEYLEILTKASWVDWAWELGAPTDILNYIPKEKIILSLHDSTKTIEWQKYEGKVGHMKYAPEVLNFRDLETGHQWQSERSQSRSFLPRSANGRWEWYRLLQKENQLLNFWREGDGSAGDQPSLFAWLMVPVKAKKFAAILGDPVSHSFTPLEHSDFFHKRGLPVFTISIGRYEWDEALPILQKLGLSHAAVTSPHKENAARLCNHQEAKALNTLCWNENRGLWMGVSTDEKGFLELIEGIGMISPLQKDIFIWGGGGTLETLEKALPNAKYFSSRIGTIRGNVSEEVQSLRPKIVIWAAPRASETLMPPDTWNPVMVYDLNYKEDSMGREYAQKCGANYQSGLAMFKAQAQGQRLFWSRCEEQS